MRKLSPRREKREVNEAFATKFGRRKKRSVKRKERHARVIAREETYLRALGVDPKQSEAPIA